MITTEGYRDILHIARHKRPHELLELQDLPWQAFPIVRRRYRLTVDRADRQATARSLIPLDEDEVREQVRELKEAQVEAVAVCLLFSFLNPEHERRVAEIVREEFPEAFLSVSSEVHPAVPRVRALLDRRAERVRRPEGRALRRAASRTRCARWASRTGIHLMTSAGGVATTEGAVAAAGQPAHVRARSPASWAASGPARPGGLRKRHHARRRRHVGRHRPGAGRQAAHEAPARHQGRAVPGDDADGRRRHDRRRRRLDRLRRRRRHLPRRPALGGRRPGPRLLRPRRHRADRHRRHGQRSAGCARSPSSAARIDADAEDLARAGDRASASPSRSGCRIEEAAMGGDQILEHSMVDGDRAELGAQGLRPARLRARRRGRRRPAVRGRRSRARSAPGACSCRPTPASPRRSACWPPTWSTSTPRRSTRAQLSRRSTRASGWRSSSRSSRSRRRRSSTRDGVPPRRMRAPAHRRLPLRRPGLRAARRRRHGRHRRRVGRASSRAASTTSTSASTRAASTTPTSQIANIRVRGDRARCRTSSCRTCRAGRRRRRAARCASSADAWFRGRRRARSKVATRFYERERAAGRQRHRGPRDRQPVRLDHGRPARLHAARWTRSATS